MNTEFEVKILDINITEITEKIMALGAVIIGEKLQKRYVYDFTPKREGSWVRLRTDGTKTTLTIKEIHNDNVDGTKELEVAVSEFEKTNKILFKLGYRPKGYQENRRTSYKLGEVELEIDEWPMIPPYLEIEAKSKKSVEKVVKKLGFDMAQTTSINTTGVYTKYGIAIDKIKELKF